MKRKNNWLNHFLNFLGVILGVYLAFYISERAKINQEKKESIVLMKSLVNDLSNDIKTYEKYEIPENIKQQQNVENLLNLLLKNSSKVKGDQLSIVFQIENFTPTTSTYSSMKSSGKLGLIDNLMLQKKLTNFYDGLAIESIKKGEFQVEFFKSELLTWFTKNVDLLKMELINKDEFIILRNKLIIYKSLIEQKVESYEMVVEKSKELKLHIESILNTK